MGCGRCIYLLLFFRGWRCFLGEVAGNRGNFFRGAALGAAPGFVSDRGLGPRAHLPARSPRTAAAFLSALAPVKVGCRLPSLSPAGWLWGRDAPRLFLPGASSLFPRGPVALPSRRSLAGERGQTGWGRPDPSVAARRAGSRARQRNSSPSARHSPCRSFSLSPPSGSGPNGRNGGKEKVFFNGEKQGWPSKRG